MIGYLRGRSQAGSGVAIILRMNPRLRRSYGNAPSRIGAFPPFPDMGPTRPASSAETEGHDAFPLSPLPLFRACFSRARTTALQSSLATLIPAALCGILAFAAPRPALAQTCIDYCSAGLSVTDALQTLQCATLSPACSCTSGGALDFVPPKALADPTDSILPQTGQVDAQQANNREAPRQINDDGAQQVGAQFNFVDNGDGTVSDCVANLIWEKKSRDDSLHDVGDLYAWSDTIELTIWDFVESLNRTCSLDEYVRCADNADCTGFRLDAGTVCENSACTGVPPTQCSSNADCRILDSGSNCEAGACTAKAATHVVPCETNSDCVQHNGGLCGFAGHSDWRIPNVKELMMILDYGENGPNVRAEFDTDCSGSCSVEECSCTEDLLHWSSTTFEAQVTSAWAVGFRFGDVRGREKRSLRPARAVRGPVDISDTPACQGTVTPGPECGDDELDLCDAASDTPSASDALEVLQCATGLCPSARGCNTGNVYSRRPTSVDTGAVGTSSSTTSSTTPTSGPVTTSSTLGETVTCDNEFAKLPVSGQTQRFSADRYQKPNRTVADDGALQCGRTSDSVPAFEIRTDGTILDTLTCLVWEKKTDDNDVLHDKKLKYTWSGGGSLTIWDWVFYLNNRCEQNNTVDCLDADPQGRDCSSTSINDNRPGGACGFAGHRDWRVPNVKELQALIDYGRSQPNLNTAGFNIECNTCGLLDNECSCVEPAFHWSSTSFDASLGNSAWAVGYGYGDVRGREKSTLYAVRAVRGPLERDQNGDCVD